MSGAITPEISDRICQHMNQDHLDAVLLYAKIYGQVPTATNAEMISIDSQGMDLQVETDGQNISKRIEFDHTLVDAEDAHHTLIDLLKKARK